MPVFWNIQNEGAPASGLFQRRSGQIPSIVATLVPVEHGRNAIVRNHQNMGGSCICPTPRVGIAYGWDWKSGRATVEAGEHTQDCLLITHKTVLARDLVFSAPECRLNAS